MSYGHDEHDHADGAGEPDNGEPAGDAVHDQVSEQVSEREAGEGHTGDAFGDRAAPDHEHGAGSDADGPPRTGDPQVDAALVAAAAVRDAEPADQLETYVGTHRSLQDRLADSGA